MKRQYYIDNLRWICILTLIPFHAAMAFNTWEGNYVWFQNSKVLSAIVIMICSFYMPLLFVLAGISMNFALRKRTFGQFAVERVKRLLLPTATGILTVVAIMAFYADKFYNGYSYGFFRHYSVFLTKITDFSGYDGCFTPAHLWFMLFLFIATMLFLLVVMLQKRFLPKINLDKIKIWQIILIGFLPVAFSYILDLGGKSIGESFILVAIGYYIFSNENTINRIAKYRAPFLAVTIISSVLYTLIFVWFEYHDCVATNILTRIAEWFGILSLIGIGKKHLEINNKFTRYMSKNSFAIYIFHFGWLVILQYNLGKVINNTALLYLLSVAGTYILTVITVEIIKRIFGIRFLFGIKK